MHNLSGQWHGRYAFPRHNPPVAFIAELNHQGDWLTGSISETVLRSSTKTNLTATVMGKVSRASVTFLKTYDQNLDNYDAVRYDGVVDEDGCEIHGIWSIPDNWSGTFIMIRPSPPLASKTRVTSEQL